MKFIFPILAIIVCGVAAYFTLTMSEKFKEEQTARLTAIRTNETVTRKADANDSKIDQLEDDLENSKQKLAVATASVVALESTQNSLKSDISDLDSDLAVLDAEFEEVNKTLEQVKQIFANLGLGDDVGIDNLAEKIEEIQEDVTAKREKVDELEALIEGAKSSLASKRDEVQRLVERKEARSRRIALNAMEARVTAVNQDWGFIVIGAGSNSGFTPQTSLLVKRDGRRIGRVDPSAIEPTQTIAEIDFDTLSPGVRIQPGDQVILAKPVGN